MDTPRPLAAALCLCGAIVVALAATGATVSVATRRSLVCQSDRARGSISAQRELRHRRPARRRCEVAARAETIRWRNITGQPTSELQFHLYWNAWRDAESTWLRERRIAGLYKRSAGGCVERDGHHLAAPARGRGHDARRSRENPIHRTRRWQRARSDGDRRPARPNVGPGESVDIEVEWNAKIPRPSTEPAGSATTTSSRNGFPSWACSKTEGWNTHQFHAATEFYSDFGVYDVRLTLPRRFIVGASGRTQRAHDNADGTTTHRYHGEDIHDFAWTASPDFMDLSRRFEHPTLPGVDMRLCCNRSTGAGRSATSTIVTDDAEALRRVVRRLSVRPHHDRRPGVPERRPMAWSTRRSSRAGARGSRRRAVQTPERHDRARGRSPVVVRHGGQQRIRARVDGRRDSTPTPRRACWRGVHRTIGWSARYFGASFRGRSATFPSRALDNDRLAGYRVNAECRCHRATPTFRYWPDGRDHHLQQDRPVAAHARAPSGLADDATHHGHLLRALAVQAPEAGGFLRRRPRGQRTGPRRGSSTRSTAARTPSTTACRSSERAPRTRTAYTDQTSSCGALAKRSFRSTSSRPSRTASRSPRNVGRLRTVARSTPTTRPSKAPRCTSIRTACCCSTSNYTNNSTHAQAAQQ